MLLIVSEIAAQSPQCKTLASGLPAPSLRELDGLDFRVRMVWKVWRYEMDGCVMEVTDMSGMGMEVTGRVRRLRRYAEVTEKCTEGMEICRGYGDLVGGVVMRSKELY